MQDNIKKQNFFIMLLVFAIITHQINKAANTDMSKSDTGANRRKTTNTDKNPAKEELESLQKQAKIFNTELETTQKRIEADYTKKINPILSRLYNLNNNQYNLISPTGAVLATAYSFVSTVELKVILESILQKEAAKNSSLKNIFFENLKNSPIKMIYSISLGYLAGYAIEAIFVSLCKKNKAYTLNSYLAPTIKIFTHTIPNILSFVFGNQLSVNPSNIKNAQLTNINSKQFFTHKKEGDKYTITFSPYEVTKQIENIIKKINEKIIDKSQKINITNVNADSNDIKDYQRYIEDINSQVLKCKIEKSFDPKSIETLQEHIDTLESMIRSFCILNRVTSFEKKEGLFNKFFNEGFSLLKSIGEKIGITENNTTYADIDIPEISIQYNQDILNQNPAITKSDIESRQLDNFSKFSITLGKIEKFQLNGDNLYISFADGHEYNCICNEETGDTDPRCNTQAIKTSFLKNRLPLITIGIFAFSAVNFFHRSKSFFDFTDNLILNFFKSSKEKSFFGNLLMTLTGLIATTTMAITGKFLYESLVHGPSVKIKNWLTKKASISLQKKLKKQKNAYWGEYGPHLQETNISLTKQSDRCFALCDNTLNIISELREEHKTTRDDYEKMSSNFNLASQKLNSAAIFFNKGAETYKEENKKSIDSLIKANKENTDAISTAHQKNTAALKEALQKLQKESD